MNGRTARLLRSAAHGRNARSAKRAYNALNQVERTLLRRQLMAARAKAREARHG